MFGNRKVTAYTRIGDFGQMAERIEIEPADGSLAADGWRLENGFTDVHGLIPSKGILKAEIQNDRLSLILDPFLYRSDFVLRAGDVSLDKTSFDRILVADEDLFAQCAEGDVLYRLYSPESFAPRPLILFLHGGGECGTDNRLQLTGTLGAIKLAKRFPEMYVMAPQAPDYGIGMAEAFARMMANGDPFRVAYGADPNTGKGERGWNRDYLGRVCDLIRGMIAAKKVDASRVYIIGMSMGGAGVISAVSVAPDLFAAAVPICPSMNGDSYPILENWPDVPVFLSTAYIDHHPGRHAYILRACNKQWAQGRRDIHYVIFTPEELEQYGIVLDPELSEAQIRSANHNSWVLALHNEYGILDWMIAQRKS